MTKICYWDAEEGVQKERDMTPIEEVQYADSIAAAAVPVVPAQVTMRQARLALLAVGKLSQVDAAIEALPSPQKEQARIEWDYSSSVDRGRPFVAILGVQLGLDAAALDQLFITAAGL